VTSTPGPTIPAEFTDADPELVQGYLAEGASISQAEFLALTQTTVEPLGQHSARVVHLFPTGNTGTITYSITPDVARDPETTEPVVTILQTDPNFEFRLQYFVPYDSMPAEVVQEIRADTSAASRALAVVEGQLVAADKPGIVVIAEALISKWRGNEISGFIKYLDTKHGTGADLGEMYSIIKGLLSVVDAAKLADEFDEIDARIDKLKRCAENPTNPITKKAHREDPGSKARLLEQVEETRNEIKANTAVMFLGLMDKTAAGLVSSVKWVGYVVGAGTAWSKETLRELNEKLVEELKRAIPKCEGYRIDKTVSLTQMNVSVTIQYVSTKCDGPDGEWVIDSQGTLSGYGGTAVIGGPVIVTIDEETLRGPVDGTANFRTETPGHPSPVTQGRFTGTGEFVIGTPPRLELDITGGTGNGYMYGFLDTGFTSPGTLTFEVATGDFGCGYE
jgi:hypothetical protein